MEEAADITLMTALDATHKGILLVSPIPPGLKVANANFFKFPEVIAYHLDHPKYWVAVQDLAFQDPPAADEKLKRWVLEAQRIAVELWIFRTPTKDDPNTSLHGTEGPSRSTPSRSHS